MVTRRLGMATAFPEPEGPGQLGLLRSVQLSDLLRQSKHPHVRTVPSSCPSSYSWWGENEKVAEEEAFACQKSCLLPHTFIRSPKLAKTMIHLHKVLTIAFGGGGDKSLINIQLKHYLLRL